MKLPKFGIKSKKLEVGAGSTIATLETMLEPLKGTKNKYETNYALLQADPELNNAITRLALLTSYAYKGPFVKAGTKLTEEEKKLQQQAVEEADFLDFQSRFFSIARHMLCDGDYIYVVAFADDVGAQQVQPLPITKTTIVEDESQIGDSGAKVQKCGLYILNEGTEKQQTFPANETQKIFHFSIDNEAEEVYDLYNRWTFGVWSVPPIECLKSSVLWKQALRIVDVLWRYRNVPREVHVLDTSMFAPEKFAGNTWEAQVQNATAAAQNYLKEYAKQISKKKVDQGYVVGSNVQRIYYVEPEKVSYSSPNELIDQINNSIREGVGAYAIGKGTYATELVVASYVILMPNHIAYKVKRLLLDLLRMHLKKKYKAADEELKKLDLRISLVLDILKGEVVRQMALLAATGTHTLDELREYVGKEQLTDEQIERLVQIKGKGRSGQYARTLLDILALTGRQIEPTTPVTPESSRERKST